MHRIGKGFATIGLGPTLLFLFLGSVAQIIGVAICIIVAPIVYLSWDNLGGMV